MDETRAVKRVAPLRVKVCVRLCPRVLQVPPTWFWSVGHSRLDPTTLTSEGWVRGPEVLLSERFPGSWYGNCLQKVIWSFNGDDKDGYKSKDELKDLYSLKTLLLLVKTLDLLSSS